MREVLAMAGTRWSCPLAAQLCSW